MEYEFNGTGQLVFNSKKYSNYGNEWLTGVTCQLWNLAKKKNNITYEDAAKKYFDKAKVFPESIMKYGKDLQKAIFEMILDAMQMAEIRSGLIQAENMLLIFDCLKANSFIQFIDDNINNQDYDVNGMYIIHTNEYLNNRYISKFEVRLPSKKEYALYLRNVKNCHEYITVRGCYRANKYSKEDNVKDYIKFSCES